MTMKTNTQMKSIQDFNKNALLGALLAAGMVMGSANVSAATASGNMTVSATLTSGCTVSASTLDFGSNVVALLVTGDVTADTGTTLNIACSNGTSPVIYTTTARTLTGSGSAAGGSIAFNLSQTAGAATNTLANTSAGEAITAAGWAEDGAEHVVPIYGRITAANFSTQPIGPYSATISMSVDY